MLRSLVGSEMCIRDSLECGRSNSLTKKQQMVYVYLLRHAWAFEKADTALDVFNRTSQSVSEIKASFNFKRRPLPVRHFVEDRRTQFLFSFFLNLHKTLNELIAPEVCRPTLYLIRKSPNFTPARAPRKHNSHVPILVGARTST